MIDRPILSLVELCKDDHGGHVHSVPLFAAVPSPASKTSLAARKQSVRQ